MYYSISHILNKNRKKTLVIVINITLYVAELIKQKSLENNDILKGKFSLANRNLVVFFKDF